MKNESEVYWIKELSILTVNFSNCGNDDSEVLKLKNFQGTSYKIPKLSRPYSVFMYFPAPGKWIFFKDFQGSCL